LLLSLQLKDAGVPASFMLSYYRIRPKVFIMIFDNKKHVKYFRILQLGIVYVSGLIFLLATNPKNLVLPLLLIPFVWFYLSLYMTFRLIVFSVGFGISSKRRIFISAVCSGLPTLIIILASLNQLAFKDLLFSCVLLCGASLYLFRADFIR
jgi:hypothetical protein